RRTLRTASGSRNARAAHASALSCSPCEFAGSSSRQTTSTGPPSMASNSVALASRASSANGFLTPASRACGSAMPPPVPVDPSASRWSSALDTVSGARSSLAAASRASSASKRRLSDARRSITTSDGARKSAISIAGSSNTVAQADRACSNSGTTARASVGRSQAVADPRLRQDIMRTLGIGFDLLPQLPHIDAQILRVREVIPQLAEQELVGEHLAGVLHQRAQKLVFLGGQFYLLVTHLHDAPYQVDREVAGAEDRTLPVHLQLMAQRRAHAGEQFVHAERLGDVVVGAEVECLDLADLIAPARQPHDPHAPLA